MEAKEKRRNIFKYIFLGLATVTYAFIMYQSFLKPSSSGEWEGWAKNVWKSFLNDTLGLKEKVKIVKPQSLSLIPSDYEFNSLSEYEENEIPYGGTKELTASLFPENTTNKAITFSAEPSANVNLIQDGNNVKIEALKIGDVKILARSSANYNIVSEYKYSIVEKNAPSAFYLDQNNISLKNGTSALIDLKLDENESTNIVKLCFYDISKLNFESSDNSVAEVRNGYIKAKSQGTCIVTVSNERESKTINVTVEDNASPIVHPTSFSIKGNNEVYINGITRNDFSQLSIDWGTEPPTDTNVIWIVNDEASSVISKGKVYGNKMTNPNDVTDFEVKAISVDDPELTTTFGMKLKHISSESIAIKSVLEKDDSGYYILNTGKATFISVEYSSNDVTKTGFDITTSSYDVVKASPVGKGIIVIGANEGETEFSIRYKHDKSIESEIIKIRVVTRKFINDDNENDLSYKVRKYISGHAFLFMIASIFTVLYLYFAHSTKQNKIILLACLSGLVVGFAFSCISEFIQLFIPGRVAAWSDIGIDMIGCSIGAFVVNLILLFILLKRNKNKAKQNIQ